jgi:predicted SnoaL-like aldol condensation-catalyzing enzyme
MNRHQVTEAANRYLTEDYIQHNPNVADGRQASIDAFTVFLKKYPERSWTPKRIFVDGDYVIVHSINQGPISLLIKIPR